MWKHDEKRGWLSEEKDLLSFLEIDTPLYEPVITAPNYPKVDISNYTAYYFDSEKGNDGNDGLSEEQPKRTLQEASRIAREEGGKGIRILFRAGRKFEGNLRIGGFETNEKCPLIVGKYPQNSKKLPVIEGEGNVVEINVGNVRLYDLEVTGENAYRGIWCVPERAGALKNVVVEGCFVHDVNFRWRYPTPPSETSPDDIDLEAVCPEYEADGVTKGRYFYRYHGGIIFLNETPLEMGASWFENVWILKNRVERVARTGITVYSKWSNKGGVGYGYNKYVADTEEYNVPEKGIGYYVHKNVVFNDNYMDCVGGDGMVLSSVENGFVERNVCYRANYLGRPNYWNAAIWVYNAKNCIFQHNEAGYTYMRHGSQDAQGFDLDNACEGVRFQFNYAHHNEGGGLLMCNLRTPVPVYDKDGKPLETDENGEPVKTKLTGKWLDNYVRNNLFAYNGNKNDRTRAAFITIAREVDFAYLTNNTVLLSGEIEGQSIVNTEDESQECYNLYFGNNIFWSKRKAGARFTVKMMKDSLFKSNLYYNIDKEAIEAVGDKNPWLFNPDFKTDKAECGFENALKIVPKNTKTFESGSKQERSAQKDVAGENAEGKLYLGALSSMNS